MAPEALTPEVLALLALLDKRGVELELVPGGRMYVEPWEKVTPPERKLLTDNRDAIVASLAAPPPTPSDDPTKEPEPPTLLRSLWRSAGIYMHRPHGMWSNERDCMPTHALGDKHAQQIISGEIPYQDAVRAHNRACETVQLVAANREPRWHL